MNRTAWAALALGWCLAAHGAAAQETDQAAIARELLSRDPGRIVEALNRLPLVGPPLGSAENFRFEEGFEPAAGLVEALVAAYEHETMLGSPNGELNFALLRPIILTRHPLTIDVLTRSLHTGNGAKDGLFHFGPSVLPGVADLATSPEATPGQAKGAMWALLAAVERWGQELGPEIRAAIKEAAILHLEGAPDFTRGHPVELEADMQVHARGSLFDDAVALAEALQDPELTAIARDARHPSTGEPGIPDRARKLAQEREEAKAVREMLRKADQGRSPPRR